MSLPGAWWEGGFTDATVDDVNKEKSVSRPIKVISHSMPSHRIAGALHAGRDGRSVYTCVLVLLSV